MSEVKFQNYSGIKNEQHNPRAVAKTALKNGYAVLNVIESGKEVARVVASAAEAKGDLYFVWNTIDKPELDNKSDYVINAGEFARIFKYPQDELVEITGDLVDETTVAVGDILIASEISGKGGLYRKAVSGTDTGYAVALEVIEVTTFGGKGYTAKVTSIA
jgi:hypothetical protein